MDKLYDTIGIECGTAEDQEYIGLMFPEGPANCVNPDCEMRYMTLPAAKALLIDLRDAIEICENHASGSSPLTND